MQGRLVLGDASISHRGVRLEGRMLKSREVMAQNLEEYLDTGRLRREMVQYSSMEKKYVKPAISNIDGPRFAVVLSAALGKRIGLTLDLEFNGAALKL